MKNDYINNSGLLVFVSYIRRYVLTDDDFATFEVETCFRLLYSEICSYYERSSSGTRLSWVFVSYIRRYVLTDDAVETIVFINPMEFSSPIFGDMFLLNEKKYSFISSSMCFRLLYSEICSYFNHSYHVRAACGLFSSPIFGDMFLLCLLYTSDAADE